MQEKYAVLLKNIASSFSYTGTQETTGYKTNKRFIIYMDNNQKKEGISVKEIEEFAKKNRFEVFFCLIFVFACIFGLFGFFKSGWNIVTATAGGILGVLFPLKVDHYLRKMLSFVLKHEMTMQLVMAIVCLALTVAFPFAVFFLLGLFGGKSIHKHASESNHH